jgi:DNA repair protein RadC
MQAFQDVMGISRCLALRGLKADIQLTRQLREASKAIDIPLLDHVVCGTPEGDPLGKGWFSFREAGLL